MLKNIFTHDPIKLHLWTKTGTGAEIVWSSKTLTFLGKQPTDVKKALDVCVARFNKTGRAGEDRLLKGYFGPNWRDRIGIGGKITGGGDDDFPFVDGGDAVEDFDDAASQSDPKLYNDPSELKEPVAEPEVEIIDLPTTIITDDEDEVKEDIVPEEPSTEHIQEAMGPTPKTKEKAKEPAKEDEQVELSMSDMVISLDDLKLSAVEEKPSDVRLKLGKGEVQLVYDVDLFPEDKISEFKLKLNYLLKIPIFRQHLWYRKGHTSFPMRYTFYQAGATSSVDMHNVLANSEAGETICDMPVNMFLYRNKDSLKIEAYDNFTLLGNLYTAMGVTEYHMVDLETFIGGFREQLAQLTKSDKYQLQMLYYGFVIKFFPQMNLAAFVEYVDERTIGNSYPQLEPSTDELAYIPKQNLVIQELYNLYETDINRVQRIDQILLKSLTETTLKVSSAYKGRTINLRILFDLFSLDDTVDALKLYDEMDGKHIILDKFLVEGKRSQEKLIPGVLYFRVVVNQRPYQRLNLYLYPNGAYHIKGAWGEDQNYEFSDVNALVDRYINPIIKRINSMAGKVMYHGTQSRLSAIEKSNVKFIDISISLFWKKILNQDEFRTLKQVLDTMVAAHIIVEKQIDRNVLSYFFKKGMFEFDPRRIEKSTVLDNYYAYLFNSDVRQKWYMLFDQVRVLTVTHRFSDVKIEISGIKEDEYYIFIRYIVLMMSMFMRIRQETKPGRDTSDDPTRITKPLSNLKEQDPHLYNFKKIYNSEIVYSKICQKPYQPLLLTQAQFDKLDKNKKDNVVKYWNFTTSTDAYYSCPNPRYPHVRFIVGKHPMGYCIPCCKITAPPPNPNDKQRRIFDRCLKEHTFQKREVERSTSRYIMSYGKPIDIGRLSHLPETSMEPLFYETKIEDHGHTATEEEDEELIGAKYYLYGVPQNHPKAARVGVLYCMSHAMGMNVEPLMDLMIEKLTKNQDNFPMLLNGSIQNWFRDTHSLIAAIRDTFLSSPATALKSATKFQKWNELFMDIALQYLEIYTLIFEDRDTVIQLRLPDYMDNIMDMQYPNHRHMILLHNLNTDYWNPVYIIHKDLYFRAGIIDRKMFNFQSDIVQLVMEMIRAKSKDEPSSKRITFDILKQFITVSKRYTVEQLLITRDNLCYGVQVAKVGYIPVHLSHFKMAEDINVSFKSADIVPANPKALMEFVSRYNMWVAHESEKKGFVKVDVPLSRPLLERIEPIYPLITVDRWLVNPGNQCIAFVSNALNFYIEHCTIGAATRIAPQGEFQKINYDPVHINRVLENWTPDHAPNADDRTQMINKSLYKNYLYQLLVLEFIQMFGRQRNTKVRDAIKRFILKTDFKQNTANIHQVLSDIILKGFDTSNIMLTTDIEKLKTQMTDFSLSGDAKKTLMMTVDKEYYNFDMIVLERLKKLPRKQIHDQLRKMATGIVQIGNVDSIRDFQFPNILQTCQGNPDAPSYCGKNRLIISRADLDRYLEILADQIKNPFVEKYLFSPLFQNSLIDYFRFTKRQNEIIEIEFL